jgi:hypothetical protein
MFRPYMDHILGNQILKWYFAQIDQNLVIEIFMNYLVCVKN